MDTTIERQLASLVVLASDGEPRASSMTIARGMNCAHASVIKLIRNHIGSLGQFGGVGFEIQPFMTKGGVQQREVAWLNEQQAALLITFMRNSAKVEGFKVELVREFYRMRDALSRRDVGAMRRYFEAELRDKESFARAQFGSELMHARRREKPALKAELEQILTDAQPGLFLN